jgi:hypothetical protein
MKEDEVVDIPNNKGYLLPTGVELQSWTEHESTSSAFFTGQSNIQIPTLDITTQKKGIFYNDKIYELEHEKGHFVGQFSQDTDNNTLGETQLDNSSIQTGTLTSIAHPFNRIRKINPFKGSLNDYFDYLAYKVGYVYDENHRKDIRWSPLNPPLIIQGYYGNVLENFEALLQSLPKPYEMIVGGNIIVVRPQRRNLITSDVFINMPNITYNTSDAKKFIDVDYYEPEWGQKLTIYPVPNDQKLEKESINVLSVENYNEYDKDYKDTEQIYDINGSLYNVNQPECSLIPTIIGYTRRGGIANEGQPFQYSWLEATIYAFVGKWIGIGSMGTDLDFTVPEVFITYKNVIQSPYELIHEYTFTHRVPEMGQWVYCQTNNTLYYLTVPYKPAQVDDEGKVTTPEELAQWFEWGSVPYDKVIPDIQAEEYIEQHPTMDGTNGFYCVMDSKNHPIMPEQWIKYGGKLTVSIERETNKIKVVVRGANLPLDVPISAKPPDKNIPDNPMHTVGFDLTGRITKDTMFYYWNGETEQDNKWVYDNNIKPYPRAPYKIVIPFFDTEKNGLYITGDGIRYKKDIFSLVTTSNDDSDADYTKDEDTSKLDNRFIISRQQAEKVATDIDKNYNGVSYTFDGTIIHPSETDFINAQRGSWQAVLDFMTYNGYETGTDSWDSATQWWKDFLKKDEITFNDVTKAIMAGTSHHIAYNLFSNIAGSYIFVKNRGVFRILQGDINVSQCSINGEGITTLGDWNLAIGWEKENYTLGDWNNAITQMEKEERVGNYTLGMWNKELLRLQT